MHEFTDGFDDDQVEAMQAAAELADFLETKTSGELSHPTGTRDLETQDPYNTPGILTLESPDDPERIPFGTIWSDLMPDEAYDAYQSLDVINVGNVSTDAGPDGYDNYHVYRIDRPETLLDGLGVVVGGSGHITHESLPVGHENGVLDRFESTTDGYHVLGSAGVHVLGEAIQAALDYNGEQSDQTMAGGYFDD